MADTNEIVLPDYAKDYSPEQKQIVTNWIAQGKDKTTSANDGAYLSGAAGLPIPEMTPEEKAAKEAFDKTPEGVAAIQAKEKADKEAFDKTPEGIAAIEKAKTDKEAFDKTPEGIAAKAEADKLESDKKTSSSTEKTFEELLMEKSAGKYKSLEELEALIKPEKKLKSTIADRLEAYVEASGAETPEEIEAAQEKYLSTQTIDFDKMSPRELIEYKIQADHPKWTDEQIEFELEKRYGVDKWKNDVKDYDDGVEPKEIRMQKLSHEQDAEEAKELFKAEQKKWAVPKKKVPAAPATLDPKVKENWNKEIDAAFSKLDKKTLTMLDEDNKTPVQLLDFAMDAKDKTDLSQIGKDMLTNPYAYWEKTGVITKDTTGKINFDHAKMAELAYKAKYFDKALSVATKQAYEKGKEKMVKDNLKNTNFKTGDNRPDTTTAQKQREEQLAKVAALV